MKDLSSHFGYNYLIAKRYDIYGLSHSKHYCDIKFLAILYTSMTYKFDDVQWRMAID